VRVLVPQYCKDPMRSETPLCIKQGLAIQSANSDMWLCKLRLHATDLCVGRRGAVKHSFGGVPALPQQERRVTSSGVVNLGMKGRKY
jgi:hypothetical protein